ncbi:TPA: fumarylacetoacetate hydrolase family protein, partial [Klebsiella pneumoniae]
MFKPISYLEIQLLSGVSGGYISEAKQVSIENALGYVAGYSIVNDVSDRGFQFQSSQWDKAKSCDTFGPVGPYIVTPDEVGNPHELDIWLEVN